MPPGNVIGDSAPPDKLFLIEIDPPGADSVYVRGILGPGYAPHRGIMTLRNDTTGRGTGFFHAEMLRTDDEGVPSPGGQRERGVVPVGVFLMLFLIESIVAAGVSLGYLMYAGASGIREIESYVRSYSLSLAETLSKEAGASLKGKDFEGLRSIFREKAAEGMMDEGFLLLGEGRRAVHVAGRSGEEPPGDRWSHSAELILAPARKKSGETIIADYSVAGIPVPFTKDVRLLIGRFLYPGIESNAWLVTRAVYEKGKPAGAVGFVVGKGKLYAFLESHLRFTLRVLGAGLGAALAISFAVSLVVFLRYRALLRRRGAAPARGSAPPRDEFYEITAPEPAQPSSAPAGRSPFGRGTEIRDAIPVRGKE